MGKQRPEHPQRPAEGAEEDVEVPGAERVGDPANPGATERPRTGERPRQPPQEPAEGDEVEEARGFDRLNV